jgi:hypothetical protein
MRKEDMLRTYLDLALLCHPLLAFFSVSRPKSKYSTMAIQNSRLQYFLVSFLSILALRYASTSYFSASAAELVAKAETCQTLDQPNPIAAQYPNNATGVLNGTIAVLPISLDLARSLIPSQYRILEHAYRALLPDFPADMYPALVQAVHDHDVQAMGFKIPDFSVRISFLTSTSCMFSKTNIYPSAPASNSPSSTCSPTTPPPSNTSPRSS